MRKFICLKMTDLDGRIRLVGEEVTVSPERVNLFKGNGCWKEVTQAPLAKRQRISRPKKTSTPKGD